MAILNNACFKNAMAASLVVALIGGPCFNLLDIPDVPGLVILDIVMVIATLMFCVELVLNWTATTAYRWSFFFYHGCHWHSVYGLRDLFLVRSE